MVLVINRLFANALKINKLSVNALKQIKTAVIANTDFIEQSLSLRLEEDFNIIGYFLRSKPANFEKYLGSFDNIPELIDFYDIERLIFVFNEISVKEIIDKMSKIGVKNIEFMMLLPVKDKNNNYYVINVEGKSKITTKSSVKKENKFRKKLFIIFNSLNKTK
jgi:uncharacterized protein YozE (UPF0346 family)